MIIHYSLLVRNFIFIHVTKSLKYYPRARARGSHKGYDEEILCKWLLSKALCDEGLTL